MNIIIDAHPNPDIEGKVLHLVMDSDADETLENDEGKKIDVAEISEGPYVISIKEELGSLTLTLDNPKPKCALHAPSANTLVNCIKELKFGRPMREQLVVDELVNVVYSRLGNDGPGFSPDIVDKVFNGGD